MRSTYARIISTAALACIAAPFAQAGESAALLAGAETYSLKLSVYSDSGCTVDQRALEASLNRQFSKAPKLRPVAEESIPDIVLNLTVDVASMPPNIEPPELCVYNINARAIHPMYGKFRYSDKAKVIQALTFNKSMFSAIIPTKLQAAVEIQAIKVLGIFMHEYNAGNPYQ